MQAVSFDVEESIVDNVVERGLIYAEPRVPAGKSIEAVARNDVSPIPAITVDCVCEVATYELTRVGIVSGHELSQARVPASGEAKLNRGGGLLRAGKSHHADFLSRSARIFAAFANQYSGA